MKGLKRVGFMVLAGALCFILLPCAPVSAQEKNPCSEDIAKFCPDVKPDARSVLMCLEEHESDLSDACRNYETRVEGMRGERREIARQQRAIVLTCKDDIVKLCKDVDPLKSGFLNCLYEHETELSPPCSDSLKAAKTEGRKTP